VSDSKRSVRDTHSSKGTPGVKIPVESPIRAGTPVERTKIVGTKKEDPPAGHAPRAELSPRAVALERPPAGLAPSQEVSSMGERSKASAEVSTRMRASAPAEPKIEEPPAIGPSDQEIAGVNSEEEVAALVSETISLLAAAEARAKQPPASSIPLPGLAPLTR